MGLKKILNIANINNINITNKHKIECVKFQ